MLKKIKLCLACLFVFSTTLSFANTVQPAKALKFVMKVELPPNIAQPFYNPTGWNLTATCIISSDDNFNDIEIVGLKQQGSVNGIPINQGTNLILTVHPSERLIVTADSHAKVQLTNRGPHTVSALCSTR